MFGNLSALLEIPFEPIGKKPRQAVIRDISSHHSPSHVSLINYKDIKRINEIRTLNKFVRIYKRNKYTTKASSLLLYISPNLININSANEIM